MGHLGILDFLMIGIYLSGVLFIGWWYSRKPESAEEYFVAKRGAHTFIVGIFMIATLLSTISYIAVPGEMIMNGLGLMWGMLQLPVSFFVEGYLII